MRIFILFISFILINISAFPQIYTLQRGERVKDGYILDENNFAVIIEKIDINNQKTFDIIYKEKRLLFRNPFIFIFIQNPINIIESIIYFFFN